jgi:hypothetical protein
MKRKRKQRRVGDIEKLTQTAAPASTDPLSLKAPLRCTARASAPSPRPPRACLSTPTPVLPYRLVRRHFARPSGRTHISAHFVLEYHTPGRCAAWASAGRQSRPPPAGCALSPPMLITFATALEGVRAWPPCRCPTCVGLLARQAYRASVVGLLFLSLNKL